MTATVETPWGVMPADIPDLYALIFTWSHFQAGHHCTVTGVDGELSAECQCGKRYEAGSTTVEYP